MIFLSGIIAGIASGMGIGGGTILIPALTFFTGISQHAAQGVNLLFFIPTSVSAIIVFLKNKTIDYKKAGIIIASGIISAAAMSVVSARMDDGMLSKLFGVLLFVFGIYELFKKWED